MSRKKSVVGSVLQAFRHGDVLVEPVAGVEPAGAALPRSPSGHVVLAEGEVTGHAHRIAEEGCDLYPYPGANDNGVRLLVVRASVDLSHEEHHTIRLPPGTYKVRVKRQYNPEGGWSPVAD